MTELGNRLREAREGKGLSLDEVQSLTKIQKRYLQGIEDGNYTMMPGSFYVRAFIKQYAEAVDLQPDELFEEFANDIPSNHEDQIPSHLTRAQTRKGTSGSSKIFSFLPTFITVIFIVGILAVVYFLAVQLMSEDNDPNESNETEESVGIDQQEEVSPAAEEGDEEQPAEVAEESESEEEPAEESAEESEETDELSIESAGTDGQTSTYKISGTDEIEVTVESSSSWVGITDENLNELISKQMTQTDNELSFDASEYDQFRIRVGSTAGTEVKINGELVEFGLSTEVNPQNIAIEVEN
ncbi:RodZ domain-containing protein [Jeotgalibacillus proteolyticus]|uniref:helix-turn-helix domain-containing protein n=1 Tax=Jeotgalibacillus proteolyticus TaxID=2082395 RepID=UPI003CEC2DA8